MKADRRYVTPEEKYALWCLSEKDGRTYLHYAETFAENGDHARTRVANTVRWLFDREAFGFASTLDEVLGVGFCEAHGTTEAELKDLADLDGVCCVSIDPFDPASARAYKYRDWDA